MTHTSDTEHTTSEVAEQTAAKEKKRTHKERYADKHPFFKWFRRAFMFLLMLPLVIFLGFWGAMQFIDFNQYKPAIEKEFLNKTGQELKINGDIEVSVIPFVLSAKQINIKNPKGFENKPDLAEIKAVEMELSLWDLFIHRRLEVRGLELERPVINLITNAKGHTNWQYFKNIAGLGINNFRAKISPVAYVKPVSSEESKALADTVNKSWQLKTLISQNARINSINEKNHHSYRLRDFDLMAFDVAPNKLVNVITEFDYANGQNPAKFHVKLTQKMKVSADLSEWQFSDWQGSIAMRLPRSMKVPMVQMETSGKLFAWNQISKQLSVRDARLSSLESYILLNLTGNYGESPYIKGKLVSKDIKLKKWLRHAGVTIPTFVDKNALSQLSLSFDWEQTPEQLAVENLSMKLDKASIQGKLFARTRPDQEVPDLHFDLDVNDLDLQSYLAYKDIEHKTQLQGAKTSKQAVKAPEDAVSNAKPSGGKESQETFLPIGVPVKTLRALHAEGQIRFKNFRARGVRFDQASATLSAEKGQLNIAPLDADLYQGHMSSKLGINVNGKTPVYLWSGKIEQLDLKPFLTDGWQFSDVSGTLNTWFDFKTEGVNSYLLRQNMNGHIETRALSGDVTGIDINKLLAGKGSGPKDKTHYHRISFDAEIRQGDLKFKKCNLSSERFSSICIGQLQLAPGTIDAKLFTTYQKPPANLSSLKGIEVPVTLKGPLNHIVWSVDMKRLLNSPGNQQKLLNGLQQLLSR